MAKRLLFVLPVALFVVIAGYFAWGLNPDRNPREVPSALIDKPVPEFALPALDGTGVPGLETGDLNGGEVRLVNFFASWCLPCRAEHPLLMQLAEDGSVDLVGINYRDKPEAGSRWLAELGNPYSRIGVDRNGRTAIDFGVSGVPETFVVDREGTIRYQHIGPIHPRELDEVILPLIEDLAR